MPWKNPEKPPRVFEDHQDERRWWNRSIFKLPFRKFKGIDETALWGPLYQRFNTTAMPILDMEAWHADVVELMRKSATKEELYKYLEERKKQRFDEIVTAIHNMRCGISWLCKPRIEDVESLFLSLFHLWRDPSLFETTRVFQTMTDIAEQAERERRRERREQRKQCREKRQERRMKREQRKKERRARFSLEVDTTSARLSPPLSNGSPPPADQPREGDDHMRGGKRKWNHQEQHAVDVCEKKRRAAMSSETTPEAGKNGKASLGSPSSSAGSISSNDGDLNASRRKKRKCDTQGSEVESGHEEKWPAAPPQPSSAEATSPRAPSATFTSSDPGYVSNIESDSDAGQNRKRKRDTRDSEAESGREAKRRAVIPLAGLTKERTSLRVPSFAVSTASDERLEADGQESCPARPESKTGLNKRKLISRERNNRKRDHQPSEAVGGNKKKLLSTPPREIPSEGPTNLGNASSAIRTSSNQDHDPDDHSSFNEKTQRKKKIRNRKLNTRKRHSQYLGAENGRKEKSPAASLRGNSAEKAIDSDTPSSTLSYSSDEGDGSSDSDVDGNAKTSGKSKTRDVYPASPGAGPTWAFGDTSYDDACTAACFRDRPTRINYEELGWIRDYGPADKELCSREHEETQPTRPLAGETERRKVETRL